MNKSTLVELLDEAWSRLTVVEKTRAQEIFQRAYYDGLTKMLDAMGCTWSRDANGKHKVY